MKISWSELAESDFRYNTQFLIKEWDLNVIQDFNDEVERIIGILPEFPTAFQKHKKRNIHFVPITKQITLYYRVYRSAIILLKFWNTYQNPRKVKFK